MAKFLPTTTQTPMQTGNTGDSYDKMLEIVGGLIKQRKQAKDDAFTTGQRERLLASQAEEDANKEMQNTLIAGGIQFDTNALNSMLGQGVIDKNQYNILIPRASDYKAPLDPDQQEAKFVEALRKDTTIPIEKAILLGDSMGLDANTSLRYLKMLQPEDVKGGSGTGKGDGGGAAGTVAIAKSNILAKNARTTGIPIDNFNVIIYGEDAKPTPVIKLKGYNYKREGNSYYYKKIKNDGKSTEWREFKRNKKGEYEATDGSNYKLPDDIRKALNDGLKTFTDSRLNQADKTDANPYESRFQDGE